MRLGGLRRWHHDATHSPFQVPNCVTWYTSSRSMSFSAFMPVLSLQEDDCEQYVHVSGQPPVLMLSSVHRCTCYITLPTSRTFAC